jgi:hypothetical protein
VPEEEARAREQLAADAKRRDYPAVLVRLDQAMDSYVQALASRGEARADAQAERLYKLVQDAVLDRGLARATDPLPDGGETFQRLKATAKDGSDPASQAIALAALGFSGRHDVMPVIQQGVQLDDPFLVDRAVLGLAVLRAPDTRPGLLEAIVLRPQHPEDGRVQAAWALYRLQGVVTDVGPYVAIWRRLLTEARDAVPAGVLVQALRGLGLARDAANAELAASFTRHPVPLVRVAAAIALGRMNAQQQWEALVALLEPSERTENVRLAARKALAQLAGGVDHGYDVGAWRKTFDRGPR